MSTVIELNGTPGSNVQISNPTNTVASTGSEFPSQAVLTHMKEMEQQLQEMRNQLLNSEKCMEEKENLIKQLEQDKDELSAERKKEMEQIIETAINDWLNSLDGISEDVRKQFKNGITGLAKKADIKNHAWEVVCNASKAHRENVAKIEELVRVCNEKEKTIESLLSNTNDPSFKSMASKISTNNNTSTFTMENGVIPNSNKRMRTDDGVTPVVMDRGNPGVSEKTTEGDAWDHFANMIRESSKGTYF